MVKDGPDGQGGLGLPAAELAPLVTGALRDGRSGKAGARGNESTVSYDTTNHVSGRIAKEKERLPEFADFLTRPQASEACQGDSIINAGHPPELEPACWPGWPRRASRAPTKAQGWARGRPWGPPPPRWPRWPWGRDGPGAKMAQSGRCDRGAAMAPGALLDATFTVVPNLTQT